MRKLISVIVCAIAVAGYMIYSLAGNNSPDIKIKPDEWKKAENILSGLNESKKEESIPSGLNESEKEESIPSSPFELKKEESIPSSLNEAKNAEDIPSGLIKPKKEGMASGKYVNVYVKRVVDGDTIKVTYKKEEYNVRFLCIDTPESVKKSVDIQPFAKEASKATEKLVSGKQVKLVFDKGLRDKYGRLLAYVFLENGEFVNAMLVRNGFARVEIVAPNSVYKAYFYKLQENAINDKAGLWGLPASQQPFVRNENGEYIPTYWVDQKAS